MNWLAAELAHRVGEYSCVAVVDAPEADSPPAGSSPVEMIATRPADNLHSVNPERRQNTGFAR